VINSDWTSICGELEEISLEFGRKFWEILKGILRILKKKARTMASTMEAFSALTSLCKIHVILHQNLFPSQKTPDCARKQTRFALSQFVDNLYLPQLPRIDFQNNSRKSQISPFDKPFT
jgi:hypothetical protein